MDFVATIFPREYPEVMKMSAEIHENDRKTVVQ